MINGFRFSVLATLGVLAAGCTTLQPAVGVTPQLGDRVAYDITDVGRVALGQSVAPEIAQIEGRLVHREGDSLRLAVNNIRFLRGGEQVWTGEQLTLRTDQTGTAYIRRPSVGRSIALGAITVGGFTVFLTSRALLGAGQDNGDDDGDPDPVDTRLGRPGPLIRP